MLETEHSETAEGGDLLGEMLDLHGEGLARMLANLTPETRTCVAADPVVAAMLLIHDLHPVSLEARVGIALDRVRPYLESHGGDVQLLDLDDGVAHLLLKGSCNGCAASASTLELAIATALEEDAPDLAGIEVEGAVDKVRAPTVHMASRLPIVQVTPVSAWVSVPTRPQPGTMGAVGSGLMVANVAGTLLAYRDRCAGCGSGLIGGDLVDGTLECPSCSVRFSLPLAGRSLGPEELQLDPVPLLDDEAGVRVATGA